MSSTPVPAGAVAGNPVPSTKPSTTTPSSGWAIEAVDLVKTYPTGRGKDPVQALGGLSLRVRSGEVFGLLGPNGAGKSTTVKILSTLSRADSGQASVAGHDVGRDADGVRRAIGLVSQKSSSAPMMTGRESVELAGRVQGLSRRDARSRADDLLERFGPAEAAARLTRTYSGGMLRKLDVAVGLVGRPSVLFLDEPTTGLDPEARSEMWAEIGRLASVEEMTVLLTTHYLDEADHLADRIAIVDHGRVVAEGTPDELKSELRGDGIGIEIEDPATGPVAAQRLSGIEGLSDITHEARTVRARADVGARAIPAVLAALEQAGVTVTSATVSRPSLDDVYAPCRARVRRSHPMTALVSHSALLTERSLTTLPRQPAYLVITLIHPMIWLLLFGQLFSRVVDIPGFAHADGSFIEFLTPGVVAMTALFSAAWAGTVYIEDMGLGVMDRMLASPVKRGAMMNGTLVYQSITAVVQTAVIIVVAYAAGARFASPVTGVLLTFVSAILLTVVFAALSNAVALLVRQQEALIGISQMLSLPLTFLSSAVMDPRLAPDWIGTVATYNPLDWAVVISRESLSAGPDWGTVWSRLGALAALALVMGWLATRAFGSYQKSV